MDEKSPANGEDESYFSLTTSPLTDSPWFWVFVFSAMALVALVAMGPKYGGRQSQMDVKYQARERIAAERAEQNNSDGSERIEGRAERRAYSTPSEPLIPLWPLAAILSLVMILSWAMLVRGQALSRKRLGAVSDESQR